MISLKDLRLYTTQSHACSYLPDQQAQTLFIDPDFKVDRVHNTRLSELGFRRSGSHIYRPNCKNCQQCVSYRVLVSQFAAGRRFNRVWRRNADLTVTAVSNIADEEYFNLYQHYISERHHHGDMYPATHEQYASFLLNHCEGTVYFAIRCEGKLIGLMVSDILENGVSAVYTFFDPAEDKRSLGTFAILWQIAEAKRRGLEYLYLGYWIRDCQKMKYKIDYRPAEMLVRQRWVKLT